MDQDQAPSISELRQFALEVEREHMLNRPLAPGLLALARGYLRDVPAPPAPVVADGAVVARAAATDVTQQVTPAVAVQLVVRPIANDRPTSAAGEVDVPQAHLVPTGVPALPVRHAAPHTPLRPFVAHVADDQEEDPNVPAEIDDGSMTTPVPVDVSSYGERINHRLKPTVCLPITAAPSGPLPGRR